VSQRTPKAVSTHPLRVGFPLVFFWRHRSLASCVLISGGVRAGRGPGLMPHECTPSCTCAPLHACPAQVPCSHLVARLPRSGPVLSPLCAPAPLRPLLSPCCAPAPLRPLHARLPQLRSRAFISLRTPAPLRSRARALVVRLPVIAVRRVRPPLGSLIASQCSGCSHWGSQKLNVVIVNVNRGVNVLFHSNLLIRIAAGPAGPTPLRGQGRLRFL
jgi:hypothetical protein